MHKKQTSEGSSRSCGTWEVKPSSSFLTQPVGFIVRLGEHRVLLEQEWGHSCCPGQPFPGVPSHLTSLKPPKSRASPGAGAACAGPELLKYHPGVNVALLECGRSAAAAAQLCVGTVPSVPGSAELCPCELCSGVCQRTLPPCREEPNSAGNYTSALLHMNGKLQGCLEHIWNAIRILSNYLQVLCQDLSAVLQLLLPKYLSVLSIVFFASSDHFPYDLLIAFLTQHILNFPPLPKAIPA